MLKASTLSLAVAPLILLVCSVPVFAGGGGGGSKGGVAIRIKNVGDEVVGVNAVSGESPSESKLLQGARQVSGGRVAQFKVKKGTFTAVAANPNNPSVNDVKSYQTRNFKTIHLYAQQDTTTATITSAPAGVKF